MDNNSRISSFKKFTELNEVKKETKEDSAALPTPASEIGGVPVPNVPANSTRTPVTQDTRYMKPPTQTEPTDYNVPEQGIANVDAVNSNEKKVQLIGKIAKLPKGTKAQKGLNFMENVKIPKSSIWYIMVEKQPNELQMLKYNLTKGVDLSKFTNELKMYYTKKFVKNNNLVKLIEKIEIDGNQTYSWIKNIPLVEIEGKKLISIITEDLIKLLSK